MPISGNHLMSPSMLPTKHPQWARSWLLVVVCCLLCDVCCPLLVVRCLLFLVWCLLFCVIVVDKQDTSIVILRRSVFLTTKRKGLVFNFLYLIVTYWILWVSIICFFLLRCFLHLSSLYQECSLNLMLLAPARVHCDHCCLPDRSWLGIWAHKVPVL